MKCFWKRSKIPLAIPQITVAPTDDEIIMYIIINHELGMSKGKIAAQAAHVSCGCVELMLGMSIHHNNIIAYDLTNPTKTVDPKREDQLYKARQWNEKYKK